MIKRALRLTEEINKKAVGKEKGKEQMILTFIPGKNSKDKKKTRLVL